MIDSKESPSAEEPDLYAEHRQCIKLADDLNNALIEGRSKIDVQDQVHRLLAIVASHFRHEEDLFVRYGYLEGPRHCQRHSEILTKCQQFADKLNEPVLPAVWIEYGSQIGRMLEDHLEEDQVMFGS
jgi:hemerythrin-like metal-binding protein